MQLRSAPGQRAVGGAEAASLQRRAHDLLERCVALAERLAPHALRTTFSLLAVNLALIGVFVAVGELLFADPAELFRELMPGTLLSVAQLAFVAVIAWAIHRTVSPGRGLRLDNFWGLSVVVFTVFAIDEATQLTIFLADGLTALGTLAPAGFSDLDAFLVTVLILAGAMALARYAWTLRSHPLALVLLAIGVALGAASQTLDSVLSSTSSEFVAEESLKLAAEPFLIGGYLVVLGRVLRSRAPEARDRLGVDPHV
jgi:hypothetical protein